MTHPQTHIILSLIANQLRDVHSQLEDKILSNKHHKPLWRVNPYPSQDDADPEQYVAELVPLHMLVEKLEQCAREEIAIIEGHQAAALFPPPVRE